MPDKLGEKLCTEFGQKVHMMVQKARRKEDVKVVGRELKQNFHLVAEDSKQEDKDHG